MSIREKLLYVDLQGRFSVSRHRWKRQFYLDVLCGRVGLFQRRVTLFDDEVSAFERDPSSIAELAEQVFARPETLGTRVQNR